MIHNYHSPLLDTHFHIIASICQCTWCVSTNLSQSSCSQSAHPLVWTHSPVVSSTVYMPTLCSSTLHLHFQHLTVSFTYTYTVTHPFHNVIPHDGLCFILCTLSDTCDSVCVANAGLRTSNEMEEQGKQFQREIIQCLCPDNSTNDDD